jgi:hypothetical protein
MGASFNIPMPQLQPLAIIGLDNKWSLYFAKPLPMTLQCYKYVLVMIEHFSKWIGLVALSNKVTEGATYFFLNLMFSCIGVPAKI